LEEMKKRVLIHSIVFSPDGVSTAYLYNDIASGLIQRGFDVAVLTTTPHYNAVPEEKLKQLLHRRFFGLYSTSSFQGIKVIHIPLKKYKSTILRIISFVYWHISSFFVGLFSIKFDFVISPSPPLTIGLVSAAMARLKGAKAIYNVQEIYPDLLINLGNIKSKSIIFLLKQLERQVYQSSAAVTTIDYSFYTKLLPRFTDQNKLKVIPNFVDTQLYRPFEVKSCQLPSEFPSKGDKFVMMYAGNIGYYQDWGPVISAAKELGNTPVEFWIIGEGVTKKDLQRQIENNSIENIHLFDYQPRHLMPILNNIADAHFIIINNRMQNEGFPSKVYTIMATAKPMIVVTSENAPLYQFLKDKNCALLVPSHVKGGFTSATKSLMSNRTLAIKLGNNGYEVIQKSYTKDSVVEQYASLLAKLD
jgi:colanic acid biosynthesis glycosyl transferase WcaI